MIDQNLFMETLHSVAEIAKASLEPLSKEEIQEYFKEMDLTNEQQEMVYEYLLHAPEEEAKAQQAAADAEMLTASDDEEETNAAEEWEEASDEIDEKNGVTEAETIEEVDEEAIIEANWEKYKPNTKQFQMYMADLASIKPCTKKEMDQLYAQLAAGEERAVSALSDQWLSRVLEMAKKHASAVVNVEDVIQEGNIGLFMGLQSLLGESGKDAESVITAAITESMHAYISEETSDEDAEHTTLGKVALIYEAKKLLAEELGHEPSNRELADYTKLTAAEVEDILAMAKEKK